MTYLSNSSSEDENYDSDSYQELYNEEELLQQMEDVERDDNEPLLKKPKKLNGL